MSQTFTRVGWNGGLGGWAERQCREPMDFTLCLPPLSSGNKKTLPNLPDLPRYGMRLIVFSISMAEEHKARQSHQKKAYY